MGAVLWPRHESVGAIFFLDEPSPGALFFLGRTGSVLPSCVTEGWDEGEVCRITSLPSFDSPTIAVQESGTMGDEGKAAKRGSSGGFAV